MRLMGSINVNYLIGRDNLENKKVVDGVGHGVIAAILNGENKILLIKRKDNNGWEPVKGAVRSGETEEDGILREIKEEVGIRVDDLTILPTILKGGSLPWCERFVVFPFKCVYSDGEVRLSDEHGEHEWCSLEEAEKKVWFPNGRKLIRLVRNDITK